MIMGLFTATRGAGNVAGGFIGDILVNEEVSVEIMTYGVARFTWLILFGGLGMLVAGLLGAIQYFLQGLKNPQATRTYPRPARRKDESGITMV